MDVHISVFACVFCGVEVIRASDEKKITKNPTENKKGVNKQRLFSLLFSPPSITFCLYFHFLQYTDWAVLQPSKQFSLHVKFHRKQVEKRVRAVFTYVLCVRCSVCATEAPVCMWEAQRCGLEIAEYALRALSSWGMCLVRAILLLIDSRGGVRVCVFACVCVRTCLFQPSSIDSVGDGTYCECAYHSVPVWPIFQPFPHVWMFCQMAEQQSRLVLIAAAPMTPTFLPLGVSISLSLALSVSIFLSLPVSIRLFIYLPASPPIFHHSDLSVVFLLTFSRALDFSLSNFTTITVRDMHFWKSISFLEV